MVRTTGKMLTRSQSLIWMGALMDAQGRKAADITLDYYAANADAFAGSTANIAFSDIQRRFEDLLEPGARVLDQVPALREEEHWISGAYGLTGRMRSVSI